MKSSARTKSRTVSKANRLHLRETASETVVINEKKIILSNLNKPMWKEEGITKRDLINYYALIAPILVPFTNGRPEWVQRFPHGIPGKGFVQKDWPTHPKWISTVPVPSRDKAARHVLIDDMATLIWLGDMACLEINSLLSKPPKIDDHDLVLIDLDPHPPGIDFEDVLAVAENVEAALKEMKLHYLMKTSGSEGIHFLIPIVAKYRLETIHRFVMQFGIILEQLSPKIVTMSKKRSERIGKIFIDYDQNTRNSIVTPFSPRPTSGAPVSFPLSSTDLKKHFKPKDYNIQSVTELAEYGKLPTLPIPEKQTLENAFGELGLEFHAGN